MRHYLDELVDSSTRILLLQGPIGPFFYTFSQWLKAQQKSVFKLNFNAGDDYFYPADEQTVAYRSPLDEFDRFLTAFCIANEIESLVCFGDNRDYHRVAKQVATELGLTFWVFEEGYFRPHYVTFEKFGVNAYSPIPRDPSYFLAQQLPKPAVPESVAGGFLPMAKCAMRYYFEANRAEHLYPNYQHHRILRKGHYFRLWGRSLVKRAKYAILERRFPQRVERGEFGEFFIVPLQVYNDSQVLVHCDFESVGEFLQMVLVSFAKNAPEHTRLIVKHHPMDRGFNSYRSLIETAMKDYPNLVGRVFYIHDVPMPVLLRAGKGMVTLNSTSGISALFHGMPVKTLGRAHYDIVGLTHQGDLDGFWRQPTAPDMALFEKFRRFHLAKTQINGNFYGKVVLPVR